MTRYSSRHRVLTHQDQCIDNWGLPLDVYQAAQAMKLGQPMLDVINDYNLRQHYKLVAKTVHADKGGNDELMAELNDAYAVLKGWVK